MKTILICLVLSSSLLQADIYYVSPDGGGNEPYKSWDAAAVSIQDAVVAAARAGDEDATVLVRKGVYKWAGDDPVVTITRSLTLRGESADPADATIDGAGERRCILVTLEDEDAKVVIKGITIKNGFTEGLFRKYRGS
ncbi:MAG: hypothetical protein ACI9R3_006544 [Verrucomicrobiales bacterium]|jgi:hypothetical protein